MFTHLNLGGRLFDLSEGIVLVRGNLSEGICQRENVWGKVFRMVFRVPSISMPHTLGNARPGLGPLSMYRSKLKIIWHYRL